MSSSSDSNDASSMAQEPVTAIIVSDGAVQDPFLEPSESTAAAGHSYSLLLLFYLTTLCAILAATCRLALTGSLWTMNSFIQGWVGFALLGIFFGAMAAFVTVPSAKSVSMSLLSAIIMGFIASFISLIEPSQFQLLAMIIPAGCLLLVLIALLASRRA